MKIVYGSSSEIVWKSNFHNNCNFHTMHGYSMEIVWIYYGFSDTIDLSPYNQNFDLGKSRQIFHHSLKEHHKISNIPKFRCEML